MSYCMVVCGKFIIVFMICLAISIFPMDKMHKSKSNSPHNGSPMNGNSPISGSPSNSSPLSGSPSTIIKKVTQKKVKPEMLSAAVQALVNELRVPIINTTPKQHLAACDQYNELVKELKNTGKQK